MKKICTILTVLFILTINIQLYSESVESIDKRAMQYFAKKEFSKAISEWLAALEIDPNNEKIQAKIENVYEVKHRKDISLQKSILYLKLARKTLFQKTIELGRANAEKAISNYVIAYRIDPYDSEIIELKPKMKKLQDDLEIELEKKRFTEEMKRKYQEYMLLAKQFMKEEKYEEALKYWKKILDIFEKDKVAKEGKRKALLAIDNRLKFEKIKSLLAQGLLYFTSKEYKKSLLEYNQVLEIDPGNDEAEDYISKIEDLLDEKRNKERRKLQAEQFYQSGIRNIRVNDFDAARDDFENVIALIKGYKDVQSRLRSIDRLEAEYKNRLKRQRIQEIDKEFQNGLLFLAASKYKQALSSFERLIKIDPKNKIALRYIQTAKEALLQQQEEIVDENSPYFQIVNSLIISGKKLFNKKQYVESRDKWEKILKLFPKNKIATEFLLKCELKLNPASYKKFAERLVDEGKEYLKEKKFKLALSNFELIKSISPNYPGINKLIANANKVKVKKTAPTASKKEINRRYQKGLAFYRKGGQNNILNALKEFRWITKRDPLNTKVIIITNKIESQLRIGKGEVTVQKRKLTTKQKNLIRKYYFRGINFYSNNKFEKAITEWRKVLAIDSTHVKSKNNIRKCLILLKK